MAKPRLDTETGPRDINVAAGGSNDARDAAPAAAHQSAEAMHEKRRVALSSVAGAVVLTGMKFVVGLATGSLGILSEAAHSALDLVAAVVTFFAVRVSGRPADRRHTYGHGKIENLSALFETLLLLGTCVWIVIEAVERLFFKHVEVAATPWAFAIMVVSIVIDFSRSRALSRVAKKYDSQALEADALHFSTDIWSSSVVLAGLGLVALAERTGVAWLHRADAAAALGVAGIVVWVSVRLGRRTIADLVDEVSPGIRDDVRAALRLPGVVEVGRVRLRRSGPDAFADVTLRVLPDLTLARGHEIADAAEAAVQRLLPGADVVVHVEPSRTGAGAVAAGLGAGAAGQAGDGPLPPLVREVAARQALGVHDVVVHEVLGRLSVEMHLEVSGALTVGEAHARATALERALRDRVPSLERIVTHIEPAGAGEPSPAAAEPIGRDEVLAALAQLQREIPGGWQPHDVAVRQEADGAAVSLHCLLAADLAITEAHAFTEEVERALRRRLPGLARVVIHVEPPDHRHG